MKTQDFLVRYIIVHRMSPPAWIVLPYHSKKAYHYVLTSGGRLKPLRPLAASAGCLEIAYIGSGPPAHDSHALFSLLVDVSITHPEAKIVYATELYQRNRIAPIARASHWLLQNCPHWLRKWLPHIHNLLTLRGVLPII